jgi:co-chaperonin GroES (HSP10)
MWWNLVLVKPTDESMTSSGLIAKPECVRGQSALKGTVVAVGPKCEMAKVGLEVSFAIFSKYAVPEDEGPFKNHFLMYETDVFLDWVDDGKPEQGEQDGQENTRN